MLRDITQMQAGLGIAMLHENINDSAQTLCSTPFIFVMSEEIATGVKPNAKTRKEGSNHGFGCITDALQQH
ncbi:MAG: hypothetical protein ABS54_02445 [Hyphomicrobium sp. SCN 65-11]|nr:MAG: hypothetical protein ABS54_02445 [Hyphomicrobium sp. SCN 65-11]